MFISFLIKSDMVFLFSIGEEYVMQVGLIHYFHVCYDECLANFEIGNGAVEVFECRVLWSLVMFDPIDDPNNVAWFLIEDFLRLSCPQEKILACFVTHCESCLKNVENAIFVIRVCCCSF